MINIKKTTAIAIILSCITSAQAYAESQYDAELRSMSGELNTLLIQAKNIKTNGDAIDLESKNLDFAKRLHRLGEEATSTNLSLQQQGQPQSSDLEYSFVISDSMDLSVNLLFAYLRTGNKNFLHLAQEHTKFTRMILSSQ